MAPWMTHWEGGDRPCTEWKSLLLLNGHLLNGEQVNDRPLKGRKERVPHPPCRMTVTAWKGAWGREWRCAHLVSPGGVTQAGGQVPSLRLPGSGFQDNRIR